jgi:hypothetical protein
VPSTLCNRFRPFNEVRELLRLMRRVPLALVIPESAGISVNEGFSA